MLASGSLLVLALLPMSQGAVKVMLTPISTPTQPGTWPHGLTSEVFVCEMKSSHNPTLRDEATKHRVQRADALPLVEAVLTFCVCC